MSEKRFISQMKEIAARLDMDFVMKECAALTDIEFPQTFKARENSTKYVESLLRKEGFDGIEVVDFPADGKTTYQDKRMPISWDVSHAKLTLLSNVPGLERKVIADYNEHPFSIVWGSVSTPEGGKSVRIIPESEVYHGEDARGALILLETDNRCWSEVISPLLDLGAVGFITDSGAVDAPDEITWVNSAVDDSNHWHVQADDRDFIGFSITPRDGRALRAACYKGHVWARMESDAHRHTEGKVSMVTATIPGESERELWVLAHMYEPLATDNSSGVIGTMAIASLIKKMIAEGSLAKPKYTIRLVYTMELYGFAAAADHFGGYLGDRCIGAINVDAMPISVNDKTMSLYASTHATPCCFNYLILEVFRLFEKAFDGILTIGKYGHASYGDDCSLNDASVGLPTVWALHDCEPRHRYHHNSIRRMDYIDEKKYNALLAGIAFFIIKAAAPTDEDIEAITESALSMAKERLLTAAEAEYAESEATSRMNHYFEVEKKCMLDFKKYVSEDKAKALADSLVCPTVKADECAPLTPWQTYAKGIVAKRLTVGMPHDLANFPKKKRKVLPGIMLYSPLSTIVSNIDGVTDLYEIIRKSLWEFGAPNTDAQYKTYVNLLYYLADGGYVELKNENELTKDDVVRSLCNLGLSKGDTVMIHSSVSGCGHIVGGAKTIVEAFLEVVGDEGTIMAPAFTRPYLYFEGAHQRQRNFRPFDPKNIDGISTGTLPKVMLREFGAKRSAHATHSWCAIGKNAEYCVSAHGFLDSPCGDNNPMEKALGLGGKVVFFGCGVSPNTFIHYLEDRANSNFLENAVIKVVREDGKLVTEVMRNHLPGCRDFYGKKTPICKFYTRAIERGLKINKEDLGVGNVYAMSLKEIYEIGTELFKEDPDVTLCDLPGCTFCNRYRHKK
ncbi:MAG: AAC(3) family N-acetyltransferase [Clostridia bacterium]|nr:AAC(3) family N-acetyltransferase [Clostridia bacterium]